MPKQTLAKLQPPRVSGIVARARVFEALDRARMLPLAWLSGPPGSGKTTVVASWLEARELASVWYRVDGGDADAAAFFGLLRSAVSNKVATLPVFRPETLADLRGFSRSFFRQFFALLPAGSVVVLDGFQFAADMLSLVLGEAAQEVPESLSLLVIARDEPPPDLARLQVHGSAVHLGWNILRLTSDEAQSIAASASIADRETATRLYARSGGWVAGLRLLIEHHQRSGGTGAEWVPNNHDALFGYFAAELFDDLAADARHILLRTSLLPRVTARLAETLTGNPSAIDTLDLLNRRHLFVERLAGSEPLFQYHGLFQTFLQTRAAGLFGPGEFASLQRQTANLLLSAGQVYDAIPLLCQSGDWVSAGRQILHEASRMLALGRTPTLRHWLRALPRWYVEVTPRLLYCLGVAQIAEDPVQARGSLERAHDRFLQEGNTLGQALAVASIIQSYYFAFDHYVGLERWIESLRDALSKSPTFPSPEAELHVWSMLQVALTCRGPDDPGTMHCGDQVLSLISRGVEVNQAVVSAALLMTLLDQMSPDKARLLVAFVRPRLESPELTPFNRVWWLLAECYHWSHEGDNDQLRAAIRQIGQISTHNAMRTSGSIVAMLKMFEHFAGADMKLTAEDVRVAGGTINPLRRQEELVYCIYASHFALTQRDPAKAADLARRAVEISRETQHRCSELDALDMLANALVEMRNGDGAMAVVREARLITGSLISEKLDFSHLLIEAGAELVEGRIEGGEALLRRALALGRARGYVRSHFWVPHAMSRLFAFALSREIETRYVCGLIRRNRLPPPDEGAGEAWPWAVRVYVLGRFRVELDDVPLTFAGKSQKKPMELLKLLVARARTGLGVDAIADALWPDAEGDAGENALRMNVHRLRKLLGREDSVLVRDGLVQLNDSLCWVDGWAFEADCESLDSVRLDCGRNERTRELGERALRLYRGPAFDKEILQAWMLPARDRWRARFLSAVSTVGSLEQAGGSMDRAFSVYGRGIEADPLCEELYQRLMHCYLEDAKPAEAYSVYRRCREMLSLTLGMKPSQRTEILRSKAAAQGVGESAVVSRVH